MSKIIGQKGEKIAKAYLLKKGWSFLKQNWRYGQKEIDLIFTDNAGKIIFIEVKTRKIENRTVINDIPFHKKQGDNIKKAAVNYCLQANIDLEKARFDLIVIEYANNKASLKHYLDIN